MTKIDGEPTLDSILLLHCQVKRNAQSAPTTLGCGQLGYVTLVISEDKYNAIPNATVFVHPQDPGKFEVHLPTSTKTNQTTTQTPVPTSRRTTCSISRMTTSPVQEPPPQTTNQQTVIFSVEVATQKATHDDAVRKDYECQAVEQALRTQIIEAINAEYLDALHNVDTDMCQIIRNLKVSIKLTIQ